MRTTPPLTSIKLTSPTAPNQNSSLEDLPFALISTVEGVSAPWKSVLRYGRLSKSSKVARGGGVWEVSWEESTLLSSFLNSNNRALEFSDLIAYCGKLYSADKATGVLYEISQDHLIPRHILMSGDGMNSESFESSWSATKNGILYIGSSGQLPALRSLSAQKSSWISIVDPSGRVNHVNWEKEYLALHRALHPTAATTLRHEAALWSELKQVWIFFPSREVELAKEFSGPPLSPERPSFVSDPNTSLASLLSILIATSDFRSIDLRAFENIQLPNHQPPAPGTRPSASRTSLQILTAKFLPNSDDNVVVSLLNLRETSPAPSPALASSRCFLMMFDLTGAVTQPILEIPAPAPAELSNSGTQLGSDADPAAAPLLATFTGIEFL
jgi:hypothetical protein